MRVCSTPHKAVCEIIHGTITNFSKDDIDKNKTKTKKEKKTRKHYGFDKKQAQPVQSNILAVINFQN